MQHEIGLSIAPLGMRYFTGTIVSRLQHLALEAFLSANNNKQYLKALPLTQVVLFKTIVVKLGLRMAINNGN